MFYVCFCHACLRFKLVHIAENMQQRPLGSHFSLGRRIRCNSGTLKDNSVIVLIEIQAPSTRSRFFGETA